MTADDDDLDLGVPGASARREHERRRANREKRYRAAHPRVGGLLFRLKDDPSHEIAWSDGGQGEEASAGAFSKHCGPPVIVLHDRRIPRSKANIDHLAVCSNGVLIAGLTRQVEAVRDALAHNEPGVPVRGAISFIGDGLPMIGNLAFDGYPIRSPKRLAALLNGKGDLTPERIRALAIQLSKTFPNA